MRSVQTKLVLVTTGLLAVSVILAGCGRGSVAKVDGRRITKQEYYNRLERLPYRDPQTNESMDAGKAVLARLIDEVLVLRLAETEKVGPTDEQVNERLAQAKKQPNFEETLKQSGYSQDQIKEMMKVEQALFNLQTKGVKVDAKEVKKYYDDNKAAQFTRPENVEVAAIFAKNKADADKAVKLLDGGTEFASVAKLVSSEPTSAENGGRLPRPIIRGDENVPGPVQDVVFNTPKGKYTKPLSDGAGGYVIFRVMNKHKQSVQKFDEVKYMIEQFITIDKGRAKKINVQEQLDKFKKKAEIQVEIERYKKDLTPKDEKK